MKQLRRGAVTAGLALALVAVSWIAVNGNAWAISFNWGGEGWYFYKVVNTHPARAGGCMERNKIDYLEYAPKDSTFLMEM